MVLCVASDNRISAGMLQVEADDKAGIKGMIQSIWVVFSVNMIDKITGIKRKYYTCIIFKILDL